MKRLPFLLGSQKLNKKKEGFDILNGILSEKGRKNAYSCWILKISINLCKFKSFECIYR